MKTLYLLRHAKSDWSDARLADHDRPLAPRGRKAARRMGLFIAGVQPRPSIVLCSSAKRARETWDEISAALRDASGPPIGLQVEEDLYGAGPVDLLARIRRIPDVAESALLVGHNPGMEDLAVELAAEGDPLAMSQLIEKFPTCALATLSTDASWGEMGPASCYLESMVIPKDLPD